MLICDLIGGRCISDKLLDVRGRHGKTCFKPHIDACFCTVYILYNICTLSYSCPTTKHSEHAVFVFPLMFDSWLRPRDMGSRAARMRGCFTVYM